MAKDGVQRMVESNAATTLELAHKAAESGDWNLAYDLLAKADAKGELTAGDLPVLANAAYNAGLVDATIGTWERAYAEAMRAGDRLASAGAAVQVAVHLLMDTALMAPIRGWLGRAEALLDSDIETPIHAWLAVVRSYERLLSGDFSGSRGWSKAAIEIGGRQDSSAAVMGRISEARALIFEGDVRRGVDQMNEAARATVSGELGPIPTGMVFCELLCGFQAIAQYDLAEQWSQAMEHWHTGQPIGSVHGRCRVHKAEVLRFRGVLAEAEQEVLRACQELRPYLRRELGWPLTELGRIRLRMGDIAGAEEAFLEACEAGWDPQPGLALVRLAQGDFALATASIADALDSPLNVPSKEWPPNTALRRAPLLEADVEIAIASRDATRARSSAEELERIARTFESKALAASAALAMGRVCLAEGAPEGARAHFRAALDYWHELGTPFEAALARMGLGNAYRAEANHQRANEEFRLAATSFERIGARLHLSEAEAAGREDQAPAPRPAPQAPVPTAVAQGSMMREGEYWSVMFQGQAVRLRDVKGMRYLARLLAQPGREFHALDLVAMESVRTDAPAASKGAELSVVANSDGGGLLDAQAKEAYRRRLADIEEDMEEAKAFGDTERLAQAEREREFLVKELARAFGLGSRARKTGSASERARVAVTRAVREVIRRVSEHNPPLGAHLEHAVRTGTFCTYCPDPQAHVTWTVAVSGA